MKRSSLESLLAPAARHELTSSLGLAVLYGAIWVALTGGLVTPLGMALACVPALLVGAFIARTKTWPVMALATIVATIGCLVIGGRNGVPGHILFGGLMLQLVVSVVVSRRNRWHWPSLAAAVGAFGLLNSWHWGEALPPGLVLGGLAAAWLTGVFTALVQKTSGHDRASWIAAATAIISSLSAIAICGFSAQLAALLGTLIAIQGLVHDQAPGKSSSTGTYLVTLGLGLGGIAAWLWVGVLGLVVGLGVGSVFFVHGAKNRAPENLLIPIGISAALQVLALVSGHPMLSGAVGPISHLWSLVALGFAAQLLWIVRSLRVGGQLATLPNWLYQAVLSVQAIITLSAASTELSMFTSWPPALTLLWTGTAALLWLLSAGKLRVAAIVVLATAVIKLLAFDWMLLEIGARVSLLLAVGTTMFVTPLVGAIEIAGDDENINPKTINEEIESC